MFDALIGGATKLIGGLFGKSSEDERNRIIAENNRQQIEMAEKNLQFQRDASQMGIRWKVDDARAAGIAPLAALGAQTFNPTPVSIGLSAPSGESPMGKAIAESGQDISRALQATRGNQDRLDAFTKTTQDLTLQRMGLENELLASQLRKSNAVGPPMPGPVQPQLIDGQPATDTLTVGGYPVKVDDIKQKPDTVPATKRIRPVGVKLWTNPWTTDAQDLEDRYGDIVETAAGLGNLGADSLYTLHKLMERRLYGRMRRKGRDTVPTFIGAP